MSNKIQQVKPFIFEYLRLKFPDIKPNARGMFKCPFEHDHKIKKEEPSANMFPKGSNNLYCFAPECGKLGSIIDIARRIEFDNDPEISNDEIADFLIDELGIVINNNSDQLFEKFQKWGWDLVPVNKNGKESWIENDWQNKSHKNIEEWKAWQKSGINIGVKTGKMSNLLIVDFDFVEKNLKNRIYKGNPTDKMIADAKKQWDKGMELVKEKMPYLDWETVQQKSFGGIHLMYIYDEEIPKSAFNYEGIHLDIEAEGGQVVIEPSIVGNQPRVISGEEIKPVPAELKEFILANCEKTVTTVENYSNEELDNVELTFENLNNNRNNTFIKLFGEMRKDSTIKVAERHLRMFNNLLDKKLPLKELKAMAREAERYHKADLVTIGDKIIDHFKIVKHEVHLRDLKEVLNIERSDIEQALRYLQDEGKIRKIKKDLYQLVTDVEWKSNFMEISKPLEITVPYFHPYAQFNKGSMIVIGGMTGAGKSHCVINFIEQFVKQGIKPKLISTEADSGIGEIALHRGLKEGDFLFYQTSTPIDVPFQDDEVRIIDWLKAPNSEFFKLDSMYEELNNKLVDHKGLLIVFSQLKKSDGSFYCPNGIDQYASLSAKFLHPQRPDGKGNLYPIFETCKIRRQKMNTQHIQIPLEFIPETKELRVKK
jgi:hypothetical protein